MIAYGFAEDLSLPFCACGRPWSQCDGSRAACPKTEVALFAELDAILREAPTDAADIGAELAALVLEYRGARETERPAGGSR